MVDPADLPGALARAFASGKPACVNVMTDGSVIAPITQMMVGNLNPQDEDAPGEAGQGDGIAIPYYENLDE